MSTERRGGSLSHAGFTPRSSARPWPLPWQSLVFTHASSVFIPDRYITSAGLRAGGPIPAGLTDDVRPCSEVAEKKGADARGAEVRNRRL